MLKGVVPEKSDVFPAAWREKAEIHLRTELPGPRARRWVEHYVRYAAPSTHPYPFVWDVLAPAEGPFCSDPDGNVLLDFHSHVAAAPLGYNHQTILQDCGIPFDPFKPAYHDAYLAAGSSPDGPLPPGEAVSEPRGALKVRTPGHLQERLLETARPFGFDCVFFTNSGAEAASNAIKIALHRRFRHVRAALGEGGFRQLFHQMGIQENPVFPGLYEDYPFFGLAARGGFHGRTLDVLSATHSRRIHKEGLSTLRWIRHFSFNDPNLESLIDPTPLTVLLREERLARTVFEERKIPRELLAFVILEPIQGEGGFVFPEPGFLTKVAAFTQAHGALLIMDEIQAGLGRTGCWWACEHFGVKPDLITSAKALRVGAVIGKRRDFPVTPGVLSTTWGGGALATSVGCRTVEVIEEEGLLENVKAQGNFLLSQLQETAERHPVVCNPRALGLMAAIDLPTEELRDALVQVAFRRGLLTLGCGERGLRFLPPLDVRRREIEIAMSVLEAAVQELEKESPGDIPLRETEGAQ